MRAQQYGAELDYMLTLVGNKGYQPFNLAAIVGASYNYFNTNKLDIDNKKSAPSVERRYRRHTT